MEHSPEVDQALRDAIAAYGRRDVEAVLATVSRAPGTVSIGTDLRIAAVLHQEDGAWKFVQQHASIGVPNDQITHPMLQPAAARA